MPRMRVQFGGTIGANGEWSNTLEFLLSGPVGSQATLQAIATAIRSNLSADTSWKTAYCTDTNLLTVKCLYYANNTGTATLVAEASGAAIPGTATPVHAPQVCSVASLRTTLPGRSYRGRTYVPYRGTNIAASGILTSTGQGLVSLFVNRLVTQVGAALASSSLTASWVVWSSKNGTGTPVAAVLVGTQADTIRHRGRNANETYSSYTPPSVTLTESDQDTVDAINALANQGISAIVGPVEPSGAQVGEVLGIIAGAILEE